MEALMIGFPDFGPPAMAKLAKLAGVEKAGTAWQVQPRLPAGQHGGGQWTTGGAAPGAEDDGQAAGRGVDRPGGGGPSTSAPRDAETGDGKQPALNSTSEAPGESGNVNIASELCTPTEICRTRLTTLCR